MKTALLVNASLLIELSTARSELRTIAKQAGAAQGATLSMDASIALGLVRALALNVESVLARIEESTRREEAA